MKETEWLTTGEVESILNATKGLVHYYRGTGKLEARKEVRAIENSSKFNKLFLIHKPTWVYSKESVEKLVKSRSGLKKHAPIPKHERHS